MTFPVSERASINISPVREEIPLLRRENHSKCKCIKNIFLVTEPNITIYGIRMIIGSVLGATIGAVISCVKKDYSHIFQYICTGIGIGDVFMLVHSGIEAFYFAGCSPKRCYYSLCEDDNDEGC